MADLNWWADAGWWQALIAGGAMIVSVGSALFASVQAKQARSQAKQAKRQADAAHGDIDPTFHIERLPAEIHSRNCCIVIRNFNRHALVVHEVRIQHPADVALIPYSGSIHGALEQANLEHALEHDDLFVTRPKTTLEGVMPGRDASDFRFEVLAKVATRTSAVSRWALQFSDIAAGRTIDMSYEVDFELLDGSGKARTFQGKAPIRF